MSHDQSAPEAGVRIDGRDGRDSPYCDPTLADWTLLADLRGKRVLLAGAGEGVATELLAGRVGSLVLLDPDRDRLDTKTRLCARRGFDGVHAVHATTPIPFAADSFDAVLVTEFSRYAATVGDGTEGRGQRATLEQFRRVLAPKGELTFTAENRYDPLILSHVVTGAGSVPARLQSLASSLVTRHRIDARSEGGYRQVLTAAGFTDVGVHYAIPDHRRPNYVFSEPALLSEFLSVRLDTLPPGVNALVDRVSRRLIGSVCPGYVVRARLP